MIECKENEQIEEDTQDYDYLNEEPFEEEDSLDDEEPDYCD